MRNTTKTFVASVGMGICAISYAIGANSAAGSSFGAGSLNAVSTNTAAAGGNTNSASASASSSTSSSASASSSTSASASSSASSSTGGSTKTSAAGKKTTKKKKTTGSTTKSTPSATPKPSSSSSTPASSGGGSVTVTKTGALFNDNDRWGDYAQVSVTKVNGKVTAVNIVQSYATSQWQGAYPILADMAVKSNGANVGNLSGATYASSAFNGALASAMSKF